MAVSIDTIYQRVLSIANKEQRGYVTPIEFNLLANQAQLEIFEQYFYDINQSGRLPGNNTEYSDVVDNINEKLKPFQQYKQAMSVSSSSIGTISGNSHKLGRIFYDEATATGSTASTFLLEIEEIEQGEIAQLEMSPLTRATIDRPYFVRKSATLIDLYPITSFASSSAIVYNYIKKPTKVEWAYTVVNSEALYNATNTTDFELHAGEETKLVIKVLELAGIVIKDPSLYQLADKEEIETVQQEKQ
tara:strand:+ start:5321 stop:6058 length:738 start_codon:yes stop_codon:yes gene_type:complete